VQIHKHDSYKGQQSYEQQTTFGRHWPARNQYDQHDRSALDIVIGKGRQALADSHCSSSVDYTPFPAADFPTALESFHTPFHYASSAFDNLIR
jgi:hypothetical protein